MSKILSILIIINLIALNASGSNDSLLSKPIHHFGITMGIDNTQLKDDISAPLLYKGSGIKGKFSYTMIAERNKQNISLKASYASIKNRYKYEGLAANINLGYDYAYRITDITFGALFIGGFFNWSYNIQYYSSWDDSHIYWLNAYELGPALEWDYTTKKNNCFSIYTGFPLAALISRTPEYRYYDQERIPDVFYTKTFENFKLVGVPNYISLKVDIAYMFSVRKNSFWGFSYQIDYKTYKETKRIIMINHAFMLNLQFKIGNSKNRKS
jgi:hypothetical protein